VISFLKKRWFLVAIAITATVGYIFPQSGEILRKINIVEVGVVAAFFITGLSLNPQNIGTQLRGLKAPLAAVVSALFLYPLVASITARPLLPDEFVIGVCIIATGPVTVSSGTIMTSIARGNVPLSLLICILTTVCSLFTIPFMLELLLNTQHHIDFPVHHLLVGLFLKVFIPAAAGQIIRPFIHRRIDRMARQLSFFQSCIIILIIFNAVNRSANSISLSSNHLLYLLLYMVFLHFLMVFLNYVISRVLKLDNPSLTAFTIHTSQKTLTITYIVWSGFFAADYPSAFIPAILCQLTQMTTGSILADCIRKKNENC